MTRPRFFVGLHHPQHARRVGDCCISINVLRPRKSDFAAGDWILDSGAFTEISRHGRYRSPPAAYAAEILRWRRCGNMLAAVSQDFMCEPVIVAKTGLSVLEHQRLTIARYDELRAELPADVYLMPVLQGFEPAEYRAHVAAYGDRLGPGAWVGVGSVCRRNGAPTEVEAVLREICAVRPDLRLHGFGLKLTALGSATVQALIGSSDSMAWSFNARRHGRNQNDWREAKAYADRVGRVPVQLPIGGLG